MIIKTHRQGTFDTDTMSYEELIQLREHIQNEVIRMNAENEEIKIKKFNREYPDPAWYRRFLNALGKYKQYQNSLNLVISQRTKEIKQERAIERDIRFERVFIQVCKEELEREDFLELVQMAEARIGE